MTYRDNVEIFMLSAFSSFLRAFTVSLLDQLCLSTVDGEQGATLWDRPAELLAFIVFGI